MHCILSQSEPNCIFVVEKYGFGKVKTYLNKCIWCHQLIQWSQSDGNVVELRSLTRPQTQSKLWHHIIADDFLEANFKISWHIQNHISQLQRCSLVLIDLEYSAYIKHILGSVIFWGVAKNGERGRGWGGGIFVNTLNLPLTILLVLW